MLVNKIRDSSIFDSQWKGYLASLAFVCYEGVNAVTLVLVLAMLVDSILL